MAKCKTSKQQDTSATSGITIVGLDIGYGVVKVATDGIALGFPSVMGHAREIKFCMDTWQPVNAVGRFPDVHNDRFQFGILARALAWLTLQPGIIAAF